MSLTTVLLLTHERRWYFERQLDYLCKVKLLKSVDSFIVADSSKDSNEDLLDKYGLQEILYLHFPEYEFNEKMSLAMAKVESPYIALMADDDFVNPAAIVRCEATLHEDPGKSFVGGEFLRVETVKKIGRMYPHTFGLVLDASSERARIEALYRNYFQNFYGVHNTEVIRRSAEICKNSNISGRPANQVYSIVSACFGETRFEPVMFGARSMIPSSGSRVLPTLEYLFENRQTIDGFRQLIRAMVDLSSKEGFGFDAAFMENVFSDWMELRKTGKHITFPVGNVTLTKLNSLYFKLRWGLDFFGQVTNGRELLVYCNSFVGEVREMINKWGVTEEERGGRC